MGFMAPLMLFGLAAAAIPVVLHMIYRKKAPRILFSTIRFLKISVERTAHRQRLQDMILLLLRCLLFGLLALALAKPFIGGMFRWGAASTNVVLVIDNSYSMGCVHEGRTRYAKAKEAAQAIIKGLNPQDKAALIFTCGRESRSAVKAEDEGEAAAWAKYRTLSSDLDGINQAIGSSQVSNERSNILWSLNNAFEVLAESTDPNKEIYVLTDMQALSWKQSAKAAQEKVAPSGRTPIVIVDCGRQDYRNLAITQVAVRAKGMAVGVPVVIEAKVLNASATMQSTSVSLHIDNEKKQWRSVDVEPGATAVVSFQYTFDHSGTQTGFVSLDTDDSLSADNRRTFMVDVVERIKVLIVSEKRSVIEFLDEGFYLANALDPFRKNPAETQSVINPIECTRAELTDKKLTDYAVVFLMNLAKALPTEARLLAQYVAGGGHVVIFLGDLVQPDSYQQNLLDMPGLIRDEGGFLPATLQAPQGDAERKDQAVSLADVDTSHPIFQSFRGLPPSFYEHVKIYRYFPIDVPQGSPTLVLASMDNGWPFLVEKRFGRGSVLMCCTSGSSKWTNLPVTKFFLPMVHQIVYHLAGDKEERGEYTAGSPVRFTLPRAGIDVKITVTDPEGRVRVMRSDPDSDTAVMIYDETHAAGVYYYKPDKDVGDIHAGVFVVNPDPQEGDLKAIDKATAKSMIASERVFFVSDVSELDAVVQRVREGIQLWNILLFVVLGIAIAECFLANKKKPKGGVRMVGVAGQAQPR